MTTLENENANLEDQINSFAVLTDALQQSMQSLEARMAKCEADTKDSEYPCGSIDINSIYDILWAATADSKPVDEVLWCILKERWWVLLNVLPPV